MKTVFAALFGAIGSTLASARLVCALWILNAVAALVLAAPLFGTLDGALNHNPLASSLLGAFDDEVLIDFRSTHGETLDAVVHGVQVASLPWILLSSLLAAAVVSRLGARRDGPGLLAGCGRFGNRAFWLLVTTMLALWGLSFGNDWLSSFVTGAFDDGLRDASAGSLGWTMTAKSLLAVLLAGALLTAQRVARLRIVLGEERFVPLTYLRSLGNVLRHPLVFGGAAILSLLPLALVTWGHLVASDALMTSDAWLPGMRLEWRMLVLFQVTMFLVQAAIVYRAAVDVRLWPLIAPPRSESLDASDEPLAHAVAEAAAPRASMRPGRATAAGAALVVTLMSAGTLLAWIDDETPRVEGAAPALAGAANAAVPRVAAAPAIAVQVTEPLQDASSPPFQPAATPRRPELRNRYAIDVTLDLAGHTADARQRATFLNTTDAPVPDLWMHLYAAAFSNEHTIYMRERAVSGSHSAVSDRGEAEGGGIEIRSVRLDGAELGEAVSIAGDERDMGVERDATLMHVRLPQPVPPGGSVTLELDFVTRFPRTVARMGMTGLHLDGMQWFPKFCAHGANGWKNRPFWSTGEFFADFGSYDVTFTWPETIDEHAVELEATGVPTDLPAREAGTRTRRYLATDVHDFAFCADPAFVRYERTWRSPDGREVPVIYMCQPYATPKAELVLDVVMACLDRSAEWWMPYPWPRLVIDGLPHGQGGGMEYPMLFTISQGQPNHVDCLVDLGEDPASVTAHEFGHQYWYGILANDEVDEAWLDEGINTWSTERLMSAWRPSPGRVDALTFLRRELAVSVANGALSGTVFGAGWLDPAQVVGWHTSPLRDRPGSPSLLGFSFPSVRSLAFDDMGVDRMAWNKVRYVKDRKTRSLSSPSREITSGYGPIVYSKTALVLTTLERHLGRDGMDRLMRRYVEAFAFRHPTAEDFLALVESEGGRPARELFEQFVHTNGTVDFAVEEVRSSRQRPFAGFTAQRNPGDPFEYVASPAKPESTSRPFWEGWWSTVFETPFPGRDERDDDETGEHVGVAGGAQEPVADAASSTTPVEDELRSPELWTSRYVVRQLGEIEAPVEIEARFADGGVLRETWDGRGGYHIVEHETVSRLAQVVVDPDRRFALDVDINNNGHRLDADARPARTLEAFAHFVIQCNLAAWSAMF